MKEQFVIYEIALKLKKLGFDEKCLGYYNTKSLLIFGISVPDYSMVLTNKGKSEKACLAPLWQQVIDWFRTKYDIHIGITPYTNPNRGMNDVFQEYSISTKENSYEGNMENVVARLNDGLEEKRPSYINICKTYEEARKQAILKALTLIK